MVSILGLETNVVWKAKEKSIYDNLKRKFAFFPKKVNDEWVWFETYWQYEVFLIPSCIPVVYRWKTKEEAEYSLNETLRSKHCVL